MVTPAREIMVLWVAYDGGPFSGFQVQPGADTVQGALENALERVSGHRVRITGAGRTDAGVHALCQAVSFPWQGGIAPDRLPAAVNSALPGEIVVWGAVPADGGFHARYSAVAKTYRYTVVTGAYRSPFWSRYALYRGPRLDVEAMAAAASAWAGTHDFSAFQAAGRPVSDPVRTVTRLSVEGRGPAVVITATADGFLYKMVRSMVGTLLEIGRGALGPDDAVSILESRSRGRAGPTAPAHGLMLWSVDYGSLMPRPPGRAALFPFLTPPRRT